jgi:hypothetical protein
MAKRSSTSRKSKTWWHWWRSLEPQRRRRAVIGTAVSFFLLVSMTAAVIGLNRLEAYVDRLKLTHFPQARVSFIDLPQALESLATPDLLRSVEDLFDHRWTNLELCPIMAQRLSRVGWIESLHFVRRTSGALFEVSADYRLPAAVVQNKEEFFLVDRQCVRLPGVYRHDSKIPLIQGVQAHAPEPGGVWPGDDLRAGLAVLAMVQGEPFARQIRAVMVHNFGGRVNPLSSHIELATDRPGGRIRWGSPPGHEVEENTIEQKLTLMRVNYRNTGRPDANHPIIDVSMYPNRFIVPG